MTGDCYHCRFQRVAVTEHTRHGPSTYSRALPAKSALAVASWCLSVEGTSANADTYPAPPQAPDILGRHCLRIWLEPLFPRHSPRCSILFWHESGFR